MLTFKHRVVWIHVAAALVLGACSHDWDELRRLPDEASTASSGSASSGASGAGGSASASTASSSVSSSGSGSTSGGGGSGGNACAPLLPPSPPCGALVGTFDDQTQFDMDWTFSGAPGQVTAVNGEASLTLGPTDNTTFAATTPDFTFKDCAVWVQIVEVMAPSDVMVRLSIANPFMTSRFSVGVFGADLAAFTGDTLLKAIPYDMSSMRYVRARESAGLVHFGYSADGQCWTEFFDSANTLSGAVESRIAVTHIPSGTGAAGSGKFDNYCVGVP